MSTYRFLQPHFVGNQYYEAGTVAATADVPGGSLPINWPPSGNVDPIDPAAISAFWSQGVQMLGLVRQVWTNIYVAPPIIFWQRVSNIPGQSSRWLLTGAGAALGPRDYNGGTLLI